MESNSKSKRLADIVSSVNSLFSDSVGDLKGADEELIKKGIEQAREHYKHIPNIDEAINMFDKKRKE